MNVLLTMWFDEHGADAPPGMSQSFAKPRSHGVKGAQDPAAALLGVAPVPGSYHVSVPTTPRLRTPHPTQSRNSMTEVFSTVVVMTDAGPRPSMTTFSRPWRKTIARWMPS